MGGQRSTRPVSLHPGSRFRGGTDPARLVLALLAVAALVGTCGGPAPSPRASVAPPSPGPTDSASATPPPGGEPAAWTRLELSDLPEVARFEPMAEGRAGVALDTTFRLTSLDGRSPEALAARITADPPLALAVASVDGATAVLRPAAPLRAGALYRFTLATPDGTVEGSWAAQAARPLHVTDSIPSDESADVPVDTGLEVRFDQDGVTVADFEQHFSLEPEVAGRFEAHGRTIAFVPARPLATARLYTMTVRHGLPLAGTGQVLEEDHVVRFETASSVRVGTTVSFARPLVDASPRELAAIGIHIAVDDPEQDETIPVAELPVTVHRLPDLDAAIAAWRAIQHAPAWTRRTSAAPVAVGDLPLELSGSLRVQRFEQGWGYWVQLPRTLHSGWYVVTERFGGVDRQTVLQVTDVAVFALVAQDRSAVWVNDLRTTDPAVDASVALAGRSLGTTDARGLLVASTPPAVTETTTESDAVIAVVRHGSRSAFLPLYADSVCYGCFGVVEPQDAWWRLFATDRYRYRSTDSVNAWGVLRARERGTVPAAVTLDLYADGPGDEAAPVASATAAPNRNGAFAARLPFRELPPASYLLVLKVDGESIDSRWIEIGPIVKPGYALSLATDRRSVVSGGSVTADVHAAFFEGTPVAGTELALGGDDTSARVTARTDSDGDATAAVRMRLPGDASDQWTIAELGVRPALPEEGDIGVTEQIAVFRSTGLVETDGTVSGTRLEVTGRVTDVAFGRFDAVPAGAALWDVDPHGPGRAGATVKVRVVEQVTVLRKVGTTYDFVLKRVRPEYEASTREVDLGTRTVVTGADGTFRFTMTVAGGDRGYELSATYRDEAGRSLVAGGSAWDRLYEAEGRYPWLVVAGTDEQQGEYSVGDTVRVSFRGGVAAPPVERYFFAITKAGLRYATVGTGSTFRTTFTADSVPAVQVTSARFNGLGYELTGPAFTASLDRDDVRLTVELTPDRARYAPGETASVGIRTLGPDGTPVAASVYVRAVDEKLYAIGAAGDGDPLDELYAGIGNGILSQRSTHRSPEEDYWDGKGDTTGGGDERSDFRDWLIARLVVTGTDGRAQVSIPLSDDLTSWRVTGTAVDDDLDAGFGSAPIPVGLPFFVEATIAPEYLAADRPIVRVRAFGAGLATGERVRFTVTSDSLPMAATTVDALAFEAAEVALPALSVGTHRVRITGSAGTGSAVRSDILVRTFRVVGTRATQAHTTWEPLAGATGVSAGAAFTRVVLVDAGRGRVVPLLRELLSADPTRADRALAAALADRVLRERFGLDEDVALDDDLGRFQHGGVALLPYGSTQLELTALAAMAGDPRLNREHLREVLRYAVDDPDESRERRLEALAGLAALGEPVLVEVRAAAATEGLVVTELVSVALAAMHAGDEPLARSIERDLLDRYGVRSGPWVRLDIKPAAAATARLAIVAASLGDPVAADMDAYIAANPARDSVLDLERALAADAWARRMPGSAASASITVDGTRRVIEIAPGEAAALVLTPAQAASARIEPVSGDVLLVESWDGALDPSALTAAKDQSLTRDVSPAGAIGPADTVTVTLRVALGPEAGDGCWQVTDLVPSGLAPIAGGAWWPDDREDGTRSDWPDRVSGQRVEWCVVRNPQRPTLTLRYVARVVTPGAYLWEPAILQSTVIVDRGLALPAKDVTIRGAGG